MVVESIKDNFNIEEATIFEIQTALRQGLITCRELVIFYMDRIARIDKSGIKLNSVIELNPEALHIAEVLDEERFTVGERGSLYGIPVLIKDNINTGDKMHTSAGSIALSNFYASEDAFVAKMLREAGAIILGKTNLTEFANFMSYDMENGYSSIGGQTLNPYGPGSFDVGGSSSGSGAAVAANLCTIALGTETSGSILSPSCQNSIVGIKPTVGLVSRQGIIPIAHSQDTAGPMARTVEDAAVLLGAITGMDIKDPVTFKSRGKNYSDYTQFLDKEGLRGARIGVPRDYYFDELSQEELKLFEQAIEIIRQKGAVIVDNIVIPAAREFDSYNVLLHEFKAGLNSYLSTHCSKYDIKTLKDLIRFNNANSEMCLKYGQAIFLDSEETSGTLTEPAYILERIKDITMSQQNGIDFVLEKYNLDAVLFPGTTGADIAARAGYPSVMVPAGYAELGMPFGIAFTGTAFIESKLIKFAYSYEQASRNRIKPKVV